MKALYITSVVTFSGKTALCLGLGLYMQSRGLKVGYMKPVSLQDYRIGNQIVDEDAEFVRRVLRLEMNANQLAPVILSDSLLDSVMDGTVHRDFWAEMNQTYEQAKQGKDIVLMEGGASMRDGSVVGLSTVEVVHHLNIPTLAVIRWRDLAHVLDDIAATKRRIEHLLYGVVINNVPETAWEKAKSKVAPYLENIGIPVFGVLPHQRELQAITIGELIALLDAQVLAGEQMASRLVENLSVGAMTVESALPLFRRTINKAVITGGDRTDLQAAALETSTAALILTGNLQPSASIVRRAEELGVAVLLVSDTTMEAVEKIESVMGRTRLGQAEKLNRFQAMLAEHLDYARLLKGLELE
ncbi:MAG: hypothetical protein DPW16_02335 [Chloroflexi bacterium]|nr:hypothetical protein [Chloroflexota bacterium]